MNEITIIIITYKSEQIIYDFIKKIPSIIKVIIIENSQNYELKKDIEAKYNNVTVFLKKNDGVSSSLNFAVDKINTKYFLQISPDIDFNFEDINIFLEYAKKLNDQFAAIGPRFIDVNSKSHKQINPKKEFGKIDSIHGSCMFINKENFKIIGKFDENFFLYFEETDYCYRAKKKGYLSYQINKLKVKSNGRSVEVSNNNKDKLRNILIWHFIWSKFYFFKKKYNYLIAIIYFTPIIIRILVKLGFYQYIKKNKIKNVKYHYRFLGLKSSILGKKSSLRID